MKIKSLVLAGVLAICSLSVAVAKTYDIVFSSPTKAGSVQLKPGEYRLKVEGTKATFTDVQTAKSFTTEVKVQSVDTKFDDTKVNSSQDGSNSVVKEIELGGSKTKIGF